MASDTSKIMFHSWACTGSKFFGLMGGSSFRVAMSLHAFELCH